MFGPNAELLERFRSFVTRSQAFLVPRQDAAPLDQFRRFIEAGKPLLLHTLPKQLAALKPRLDRLRQWLLPPQFDLLKVAHLSYDENAYTELMAWSLSADAGTDTALARHRQWLHSLGISGANELREAVKPMTQVSTDDGRPDMVLQYPSFVVVVEAKTGSEEHPTPRTNQLQTVAYPAAVRKWLGLDEAIPIHMVFLTPDRRSPANEEAIPTTYLDFAVALASVLTPSQLLEDAKSAFKLWITHLATCALPGGVDFRGLLRTLEPLLEDSEGPDAKSWMLTCLADLNRLLTLLPMRIDHELL